MKKPQVKRNFKANLFFSKAHLHGLTLGSIGKKINPPVGKWRVWQIVHTGSPDHRLREIAAILKTNVQTLWPREKDFS